MLRIEVFTDPGCPIAWSAEPRRRRIQWLYGDQIAWTTRMVGLAETPDEVLQKGLTPERQAATLADLHARHGMPIDARRRPRAAATAPACLAFVAARRHAPERAEALLQRLRIRTFVHGELLDEEATIARAAREAGIDPGDLAVWSDEDGTLSALREDMRAARSPLAPGAALDHKLAGPERERRYTCPTWVLGHDDRRPFVAPGLQPVELYEVLVANAAPELSRREEPGSAAEVLRALRLPLAAAEVAGVMRVSLDDARAELERVADERDGLWSPAPRFARDERTVRQSTAR